MADPLRIVVTGSECTGKTTLAEALARHYGTVWVPEFARDFYAAKTDAWTVEDMPLVAAGHLAREAELAPHANRLIVLDTDAITSVVYAEHYYGELPPEVDAAAREHPADLYLLCDIDVPWVADGQRDRPDARESMQDHFRRALRERGFDWVDVAGPLEVRLAVATRAIDVSLAGDAG